MVQGIEERRSVVRERTFQRSDAVDDLLRQLHWEKFTGQLVVHMSQGAINCIRAEDRQNLTEGSNGEH